MIRNILVSTLIWSLLLKNDGTRQSMEVRGTNYSYGWKGSSDVVAQE